jgi:tetratricopeptide (TPR) repeat protein
MNESLVKRAMELRDPAIAEEAFHEFDAQIQQSSDPNQKANLFLEKAVLYGVFHLFADARKALELALAQTPDDPDIQLQVDHIRASLYDQEGNSEKAFEHLTAVLSEHREKLTKPGLRFMYEDIQLRRGFDATGIRRFHEAVPPLVESLGFDLNLQDRSNVLSSLGLCFSELGQYERAKEYFLQACKIGLMKDWEGEVHMRLAIAYAHLDLFPEAKREFQLCEEKVSEYGLDAHKIYGWLSWVSKGLGEMAEAEKYARLLRPS